MYLETPTNLNKDFILLLTCLIFSPHYFLRIPNWRLTTKIHYTLYFWSILGYLWDVLSASASKKKFTVSDYFMASAFQELGEALLYLSTIPHLGKNGGCAIYIYITAIKPNNYCSWGLGPHRTVLKVCWILQLHVILIISPSLTLEGSYLC